MVIELGGKPLSRLDYDMEDVHINPDKGPRDLRRGSIKGPHAHLWQDNRTEIRSRAIPRVLRYARSVPSNTGDFSSAFEWFCQKNHITINRERIPDVPTQRTLL